MLPGPYKQTPAQRLSRASRKPAVETTSAERHAGAFARQFCADKYRCLRVGQRRLQAVSSDKSTSRRGKYADRYQEADQTSVWPNPGPRGLDDTVLMKHERIAVKFLWFRGSNQFRDHI